MKIVVEHRKLLGVDKKNCYFKRIKAVHRNTMKDAHPDKFVNDDAGRLDAEEKSKAVIEAYHFLVRPNPATETAVARFNVGSQYQQATAIAVFDVTGVQRLQQKVSGKQGEVQLNISHLAAGTYMVNLQADGVNIAQQKLIKK